MSQILFFIVPNIPITNKESGILTRALPTPTEKGIFFFHQSETYELICNYASCWWITHPHQRTVVRNNWPVAMYISDGYTDNICKECGNNTYINLISNVMFWHFMQTNFHGFMFMILNRKSKNNTPPRLSKMTYEEKSHIIFLNLLGILY